LVVLVKSDLQDDSNIERALINAKIEYQMAFPSSWGNGHPYLIVDGVPLDEKRALKWIGEHMTDE
jgi:hypothetical protein